MEVIGNGERHLVVGQLEIGSAFAWRPQILCSTKAVASVAV
jgi:hypothetical protein